MCTTSRFGRAVALIVVAMFAAPRSGPAGTLSSWSRVIPDAEQRFVVLAAFGDQAVLDRETNLVWERSPGSGTRNWHQAMMYCANRVVGKDRVTAGRFGWRLPTIEELQSLIYPIPPELPGTRFLPPGHPFENIHGPYWSATTFPSQVPFGTGTGALTRELYSVQQGVTQVEVKDRSSVKHVWCVRGGQGQDDGL